MSNQQSYAPFSCTFSREVPDILGRIGCSLVISTYQAGKLMVVGPADENLSLYARNFDSAMGVAVEGPRIAVATANEVVVLRNAPEMALSYPSKPGYYDALFLPRASYSTGRIDLHDMAFAGDRLWAVSTTLSALGLIDEEASFTPMWTPPFVSALAPEDRCHLNGLAMAEGRPRFLTALGATDSARGWSENRLEGGVVIDKPSGEVVVHSLAMPHSPRLYDGELYVLSSAEASLLHVDLDNGSVEVVNRLPGFCRGLARYGDYLFIGISRLRKTHVFGDLPIATMNPFCGVVLLHLPSGRIAGQIEFLASCEEIYDVQVLEGVRRAAILNPYHELAKRAVWTPEGVFWSKPEDDPKPATSATVGSKQR